MAALCTSCLSLDWTCLTLAPFTGTVSVRSHSTPEAPGNSIGLEAIIRKALMGKYDDQSEERTNAANTMGSNVSADGRAEDCFSQGVKSSHTPVFYLVDLVSVARTFPPCCQCLC